MKEYSAEEVSLEIADAQGRTVRKLKGPSAPGYNSVVWDLQPDREERITARGRGGQPQLMAAGEYTVTMKVKGREDQKVKLTVTAPEGVGKYPLAP